MKNELHNEPAQNKQDEVELMLRKQLRKAKHIVEEELGCVAENAVVAVFEQLCFYETGSQSIALDSAL